MPQKKNPDAAELVRAKTGRINGSLVGLLTVMKGLPLAYSKDMQEDKEPVFDAAESLELALAAMTGMVRDMTGQRSRDEGRRRLPAIRPPPTSPTGWCARRAFPSATPITSPAARWRWPKARAAIYGSCRLPDLQAINPAITDKVFGVLTVEASVASRTSYGGTAPAEVRQQIAWWRARNEDRRINPADQSPDQIPCMNPSAGSGCTTARGVC